jgi:hypothetical protein
MKNPTPGSTRSSNTFSLNEIRTEGRSRSVLSDVPQLIAASRDFFRFELRSIRDQNPDAAQQSAAGCGVNFIANRCVPCRRQRDPAARVSLPVARRPPPR